MPSTVKALQRASKELKKQEARVATWLLRLAFVLMLGGWAFEQWAGDAFEPTGRGRRAKAKAGAVVGKQALVWVGGAMGVVRLLVRWYFVQRQKVIDEELLELEPEAPPPKKKKVKRQA
ncbi:hypothetical protein JCM8547_008633 [Rhodosporidiobolus lusitaniae]